MNSYLICKSVCKATQKWCGDDPEKSTPENYNKVSQCAFTVTQTSCVHSVCSELVFVCADVEIWRNGSLVIRGATSDDSGHYTCRVLNVFTSATAELNLTVSGASPHHESCTHTVDK